MSDERQMRIIYDDGEIIDTVPADLEYWLRRRYEKSQKTPKSVIIFEEFEFEATMNVIETEFARKFEEHETAQRRKRYEALKKEFEKEHGGPK